MRSFNQPDVLGTSAQGGARGGSSNRPEEGNWGAAGLVQLEAAVGYHACRHTRAATKPFHVCLGHTRSRVCIASVCDQPWHLAGR